MSKVAGSYSSLSLGVSEQVSHDRKQGQHEEQVNMISDPVNGLTRRKGSIFLDSKEISNSIEDINKKNYDFSINGRELSLIYRDKENTNNDDELLHVFDKDKNKFLDIEYDNESQFIQDIKQYGISSVIQAGIYLYMSSNKKIGNYEINDIWDNDDNKKYLAAWIRGGAYSRKFSITLIKPNGDKVIASYTTMSSAYGGVLNTRDIDFYTSGGSPREDYTKDINDAIYDYRTETNQHTVEAAEDIAPSNIAEKLKEELVNQGVNCYVSNSTVCINDPNFIEIDVDDDGDKTLVTSVGQEIKSVNDVTTIHKAGKVVKVKPSGNDSNNESFYLKAEPKTSDITTFTEVTWRETAGVEQKSPALFAQGIIYDDIFYVADNGEDLDRITPAPYTQNTDNNQDNEPENDSEYFGSVVYIDENGNSFYIDQNGDKVYIDNDLLNDDEPLNENGEVSVGVHPRYISSKVGDIQTNPTPFFSGKKITMLSMFQDRLVIGCENVLNFSKTGDYLNFFKTTILDINEDDPIELYSYSSNGDVLRQAVGYNKNLLIFGDKKQYIIPGERTLSPRNPIIINASSHEDTTQANIITNGNYVFYGKTTSSLSVDKKTTLNQIQAGVLNNSPSSYDVSIQLDKYIKGNVEHIIGFTSPNFIIMKTNEFNNGLYIYRYIDQSDGSRVLDSWSKFKYNEKLGKIISFTQYKGDLILFSIREKNGKKYIMADIQSLRTTLSDKPYFDSAINFNNSSSEWHNNSMEDMDLAFDNNSEYYMMGTNFDNKDDLLNQLDIENENNLWYGISEDAYVVLTNPYPKDRNDNSILSGRLTINKISPTINNTGVIISEVTSNNKTVSSKFNSRILGNSSNLIDRQPIVESYQASFGVGREIRDYTIKLKSQDWLPLSISSVEYKGQYFNRTRRM